MCNLSPGCSEGCFSISGHLSSCFFSKNIVTHECHTLGASRSLISCWFSSKTLVPQWWTSATRDSSPGFFSGLWWAINQPVHFFTSRSFVEAVGWDLLTLPPPLEEILVPGRISSSFYLCSCYCHVLAIVHNAWTPFNPLPPSLIFLITSGWQIATAFHSISPGTASSPSSWGFWPFSRCLLQPPRGLRGAVMDSR